MGTDGRKPMRLGAEAGRFIDEARVLGRGSGRLAVRGALARARARMSGQEPSLRWVPSDLSPRYDVVVVGGTLGGLFLAHELARRLEARVALVEPERVGAWWPSRARTGLAAVGGHAVLADLAARSRACYEKLAALAFPLGFGHADVVTLARSGSELDRLSARLGARPAAVVAEGVRVIGVAEAASIVPHLDAGRWAGALLEPGVTTVGAATLPWLLAAAAARGGVAVVEGCRLSGATRVGGSWSLSTSAGRTEAPLVVDASPGADVLAAAGIEHHCLWQRWETLTTDPLQPFLRAQIRAGDVEVHQSDQGEVCISGGAGSIPPGATTGWLATASALAGAAVELLPPLAQLRLASRAWRTDLMAADGLPVVGPVVGPGVAEGLHRLGGLGADPLALAPAAAEALAQHLVDERPSVPLGALDPRRLGTGGARSWAEATAK